MLRNYETFCYYYPQCVVDFPFAILKLFIFDEKAHFHILGREFVKMIDLIEIIFEVEVDCNECGDMLQNIQARVNLLLQYWTHVGPMSMHHNLTLTITIHQGCQT